MAVPTDKKVFAEWVRLRRIRKEQLEKVAATRAAIGRFGDASSEAYAKSRRRSLCLVWFLVTLSLLVEAPRFYEFVVEPLIEEKFSAEALREFVWKAAFLIEMILLMHFYDKTPVNHLSSARKAAVNFLLCIGGVVLYASFLPIAMGYDVTAVFMVVGSGFILWSARRCAKVNEA
jgi:hypothetical protein